MLGLIEILLWRAAWWLLTCGDGHDVGGVSGLVRVPALQHHAVLRPAGQPVHHQGPPGGQEGRHHGGGGVPRQWLPVAQLTLAHTAVMILNLQLLLKVEISGSRYYTRGEVTSSGW